MTSLAHTVLQDAFGYAHFRGSQQAIVDHVIGGDDALVLMPTGGGKSLCYQIPAIVRQQQGHGTTIVISPLIALMHDQVSAMHEIGVDAAFLNSTLDYDQTRDVELQLLSGGITLLYVAPERLNTPRFLGLLDELHAMGKLALFAIDEAHCVSQWGHDFRPEYRELTVLHQRYAGVPRIALTATADALTRADIVERMQLESARVFISSFDRANIRYTIVEKKTPPPSCCALSSASTMAMPAWCTAYRAKRWKRWRNRCAMPASTPCPTTPAWAPSCAKKTKAAFYAKKAS